MGKRKVLNIDYYENFRCIGSDCEDTCCKDWKITVDKKTYVKYKKLPNTEFKSRLLEAVGRNRRSKTDLDYAAIKLVDRKCPLISKDGLCEVYINIGEENMCHTCKVYPRYYNLNDDIIENSLSLSCIEVAKLALLRTNPIEFNIDLKEIKNFTINKEVNTSKSKKIREKYFNEIRSFSIGLVQNRKFTIEERLAILGLFINEINEINDEKIFIEIINRYITNINNGLYDGILKDINSENAINAQLEFLTNIYKIMISKNIVDKIFMKNFVDVINNLKLISGNPELIKESFIESFDENYKPFIDKHDYMYENYLVSYMFKTFFPINNKSFLDTYISLIINFSIIKMELIGICGHYKEEMDTDKAVKVIQSFVKVMEHDTFLVDKLQKYLSENELNTFVHMVILIGK